jgi:hypothetical protein
MNTRGARVAYATPEISEWLSLDRRLAVRRGLRVGPVPQRDAESPDPMNVEAAPRAVQREVLKLSFEIGLRLQQFEPGHIRVDRDEIGAPAAAASSASASAFVAWWATAWHHRLSGETPIGLRFWVCS